MEADAGFNKQEASEFVATRTPEQEKLDFKRGEGRIRITPVEVKLGEELDVSKLSAQTKRKVDWNKKEKVLTFNAPLTEEETEEVSQGALMDATREAINRAGEASRTEAVQIFHTPSERGKAFFVPQMEVLIDGELRLFDEPEAIDYPWDLPMGKAYVTEAQLSALEQASKVKEAGLIDVDEDAGRVKTSFSRELSRDLGLSYKPKTPKEATLTMAKA